jgi:outer membrane protein assembly factor BamD (BamD/ComL family)
VKLFETGILYMKMEEYYSARMTFNKVIDLYYDTPIVYEAKAGLVEAFAYNKEIDEAYKSINSFETDLKDNNLYEDAMETIIRIEKMVSQRK